MLGVGRVKFLSGNCKQSKGIYLKNYYNNNYLKHSFRYQNVYRPIDYMKYSKINFFSTQKDKWDDLAKTEEEFEAKITHELEEETEKWLKKVQLRQTEKFQKLEDNESPTPEALEVTRQEIEEGKPQKKQKITIEEAFEKFINKKGGIHEQIQSQVGKIEKEFGIGNFNVKFADDDDLFSNEGQEEFLKIFDEELAKVVEGDQKFDSKFVVRNEVIENDSDEKFLKDFLRDGEDEDFDDVYDDAVDNEPADPFEDFKFSDLEYNSRKANRLRNSDILDEDKPDRVTYKRSEKKKLRSEKKEENEDPDEVYYPNGKYEPKYKGENGEEEEDVEEEGDFDLDKEEDLEYIERLHSEKYQKGVIPNVQQDKDAPKVREVDGDMYVEGVYVPPKYHRFVKDEEKYLEQHPRTMKLNAELKKKQQRLAMEQAKKEKRRMARKTFGENNLTVRQLTVGTYVLSQLEDTLESSLVFKPINQLGVSIDDVIMSRDLSKAKVFWSCDEKNLDNADATLKKMFSLIKKYFARKTSHMKRTPQFIFVKPDLKAQREKEQFTSRMEGAVQHLDEDLDEYEKETGDAVEYEPTL